MRLVNRISIGFFMGSTCFSENLNYLDCNSSIIKNETELPIHTKEIKIRSGVEKEYYSYYQEAHPNDLGRKLRDLQQNADERNKNQLDKIQLPKDNHLFLDDSGKEIDFLAEDKAITGENILFDKETLLAERAIETTLVEILKQNPEFKKIMILLTLIRPSHIPTFLLDWCSSEKIAQCLTEILNHNAILTRDRYLKSHIGFETWSIYQDTHKVIQDFIWKKWEESVSPIDVNKISKSFEKLIFEVVKNEEFAKIHLLIPHIELFLKHITILSLEQRAYVGCELAGAYSLINHLDKALEILENSQVLLNRVKSSKPHNHKAYAKLANILVYKGIIYRRKGMYEQAIKEVKEGLSIYQHFFKNDLWRLSWSYEQLGQIYIEKGDFDKAKIALQESLKLIMLMDDKDYLQQIIILNRLAKVSIDQGRFEESKKILKNALKLYKNYFSGNPHRAFIWTQVYLGKVYNALGQLEQSERSLRKAYRLHSLFAPDKVNDSALILIYLGEVLIKKGRYGEAREIFLNALQKSESTLPSSHPQILLVKHYLEKI